MTPPGAVAAPGALDPHVALTPPVVLSIAGSDSSGGAGIQADLAVFGALRVIGACALTAITAQSTTGVHLVHPVPDDVVGAQIAAVAFDMAPAACKTGMLATPGTIARVAALAAGGALPLLVVDPVLTSSAGQDLAGPGAEEAYRELLLPHATVTTPNVAEAGRLLGRDVASTPGAMAEAAAELAALGPRLVVVTGGDAGGGESVDVAHGPSGTQVLRAPRVRTRNTHGTGCAFSAATSAWLALGEAPPEAVRRAKALVAAALRDAAGWSLGAGRGGFAAAVGLGGTTVDRMSR